MIRLLLRLLPGGLFLAAASATAAPRPNIILAMADDMGWGDPHYNSITVNFPNGTPHPDQGWIQTPTLDNMVASGLRFGRFYAASAVCSPTRGSCLTGRNPLRLGIPDANAGRLEFDETPLSEVLSAQGYRCGHFGKWHLGSLTTLRSDANRGGNASVYSGPWHHGYDTCFVTESKVPTYHPYRKTTSGLALPTSFSDPNFYGTRYWRMPPTWNQTSGEGDAVPVEEINNATNGDDSKLLVDQVIPFIQDAVANNEPFFVVLWFHTPHKPLVDPDGVSGVDSSDALKDAIEDLDLAVGRLRNELTTLGVRGNTMLWLTSDNGPENGDNSPNETSTVRSIRSGRYLERKRSLHEGGVRVPGILEWPDVIGETGGVTEFPAVTSDYYPTILDYLELSVPGQKPLDGISLRPVVDGTATTRAKPIGFQYNGDKSWVNQQYKLVNDNGTWELYDLLNIAPGEEVEQTALATSANIGSQPQPVQDVYNTMLAEYNAWAATVTSDTDYVHASQPTVALSTPSGTVSAPFTVTATFSKNVTQLHANEFAVGNGTASGLTGSGTTWTLTVNPSSNGDVTIQLPEGAAIDSDGSLNAPSNLLTATYTNPSAPDVLLTAPADPVNGSFVVTATFSEDVSGVELGDFQIGNGSAANLGGGPAVYTISVTPAAAGSVSVFLPGGTAQDSESNSNNASNTLQVTYAPPSPPSVSLLGPATTTGPYLVTISFSEPVTGLTAGDFDVPNGTASALSGSGAAYTVSITPTTPAVISVSLPAGSATDLDDGLGNTASNTLATTYAAPPTHTGERVETMFAVSAGQTVDGDGNFPGDGSNNVDKFDILGTDVAPFTTTIYVRGGTQLARQVKLYLQFDLTGLTTGPVSSATLQFEAYGLNSLDTNEPGVFAAQLANDWAPAGTPDPVFTPATVGTPASGGTLAFTDNATAYTAPRIFTFDVKSIVQSWQGGDPNHGLLIYLDPITANNGLGIRPSGDGAIQLVVEQAPLHVIDIREAPTSGDVTIEWNSAPGALYQVQVNDRLQDDWTPVATVPGAADVTTTTYTHVGGMSGFPRRFYRIGFLGY